MAAQAVYNRDMAEMNDRVHSAFRVLDQVRGGLLSGGLLSGRWLHATSWWLVAAARHGQPALHQSAGPQQHGVGRWCTAVIMLRLGLLPGCCW